MKQAAFLMALVITLVTLALSLLAGHEVNAKEPPTGFASDRTSTDDKPETLPPPKKVPEPAFSTPTEGLGLPELIRMTVERNPRLVQASLAISAAQGQAVQAGLCPNPIVSATGDELLDRTGRAGIWTAPFISQEIVTCGKLKISRAAALKEVSQASLALLTERYNRFTAVRQAYFEVLTLQRRIDILAELLKLADQSVETTRKLLEGKLVARLDLVQLEVDQERLRADLEATRRELVPAFRRLAAAVGVPNLPYTLLAGSLQMPVPEYDLDSAHQLVLDRHPELQSARVGVERYRLLLKRAQVEPIPNVTVGAGYTYQDQNKSNDFGVSLSLPVPVWNRNQGNIATAQADVSRAVANVATVENDLVERLATAFQTFTSALQRSERYRDAILPKARETYQLSLEAFKGGQFEYLRVLQAQRAVVEADLEYNRTLGEMWRAASEIAGLLLEEQWPAPFQPRPVEPKKP